MTVAVHIAEWFNPGNLIIKNKYDGRNMKYIFSITEKKVVCTVVVMYSISIVIVKTYATGSIDFSLL
jgi:hypothetical protein